MSTDAIDLKHEAAEQARESATECGLCGVELGVGPGKVRKAHGIVDKEQPGLAVCLECAWQEYGDTNIDGEYFDTERRDEADDLTLYINTVESPSYRAAMLDAGRGHLLP